MLHQVRFLESLDNVAKICLVISTGKGVGNNWNPVGPGKCTGLLLTTQCWGGANFSSFRQISVKGHPIPPVFFYHSLSPKSSKAPIPVHLYAASDTHQSGPDHTQSCLRYWVSQLLNPLGLSGCHRPVRAGLATPVGSVWCNAVLIPHSKH